MPYLVRLRCPWSRPVLDASNVLTLKIESNPDDFLWLGYESKLNEVRRQIARLVNVDMDECVLVPNVCNVINTILRNFEWREGDAIASASKCSSQRRVVAIVDSIVSGPGAAMPWRDMVRTCKEEGVWSVIDAAHPLGQEAVDLNAVQPDFWVSSCSKWLFARRGCAVLYVPKKWFRESLGGEEKINAYCRSIALAGGKRLAGNIGHTRDGPIMRFIQVRLLELHKVYASAFYHNHRWWTRASAQVYNEVRHGQLILVV
ncbi:pyridoxal phosphate-dependent transferase [Rhodofomes roseus]|uniref:Pyridoxal phosphate-dependent transferase n=1 Tax=Rhodofomes roseus TaxID=34475 RepID=A0ABQ8K3B6_9APHY|nr:pyridoxal phosphate-dependent transferase [Rhodofomes roseus]KAH9831340.1 pyridoxal phosphate-dependent transferase [Rhodofomes roseus]